jgi:hypothetical protein
MLTQIQTAEQFVEVWIKKLDLLRRGGSVASVTGSHSETATSTGGQPV